MNIPLVAFATSYIACVLFYLWLCCLCKHPGSFATLSVTGLFALYFAYMTSVIVFQHVSIAFAKNDAEIDAIVASDGAKLVAHGLFFAPATSVSVVLLGCLTYAWRQHLASRTTAFASDGNVIPRLQDDNPYRPPISDQETI